VNKKVKLMFKRLLRDKRAITPVLSSLLLTVVAVAAMAIATSATYMITANLKDNMSERVIVEDVWFNNATHTVDVYVHNIGKVAIRVSGVYVNHTNQSFNSPFRLELDGHDWLIIACSWSSGDLYYIDIVTNRGTHLASYYKAP
jgi:FlaG/FlaF family flagellin (archaellin)